MKIRRATCNMDHNARRPGSVVARTLALSDVVGWQECRDPDQRAALRRLDSRIYATYWPGGSANLVPITWRRARNRVVATGRKRVHRGFFRVSPARWIVWVILEDDLDRRVAHVNTHFIQGRVVHRWRRRFWARHLRMLSARVEWLKRTYGCEVIVGADWNAQRVRIPGCRTLAPSRPTKGRLFIDYFALAGQLLRVLEVRTQVVGSDHRAVVVTLEWVQSWSRKATA